MKWTRKDILLMTVLSIVGIACFPVNPLVLTGVLETNFYPALFAIGWVVWAVGMALILSLIIMFPRRGGVPKGKSFVETTRLVVTGSYALVRHPQYLGGILSIFVTTLLWYPHWLFAVLGMIGTLILYLSAREEDQRLIEKFGDAYITYMSAVPRMNIVSGIVRLWRNQ